MQYMLLIYRSQDLLNAMSTTDRAELMEGFDAFDKTLEARGALRSTEALHPVTAAKTVRVRDGKAVLTDGPFAETKEQLGGYYVVETKDLDEAIELAAQIPIARIGAIEIRPIMVFG
jgi:hypothetical protein